MSRAGRPLRFMLTGAANTAFEFSTKPASWSSLSPSSSVSSEKLWITRLMLRRRSASASFTSRA